MQSDERTQAMLRMARELARRGHGIPMIEVMLEASGFREAYRFLDQPNVQNELLDIADRARRGEPAVSEEAEATSLRP